MQKKGGKLFSDMKVKFKSPKVKQDYKNFWCTELMPEAIYYFEFFIILIGNVEKSNHKGHKNKVFS